ncbi:MAG: O-acetyl-ADP-ribose deacetylase [Oscillospiraceae bacterium]|nr:O-acetyl-ADP-ribose deacetylase [Oscillospiraceae bacterium]
MPFFIVRNDITKMQVDAIVNAARPSLLGGGGVDGAIHAAAGPELLEECRTLGGCEIGQAKLTRGYRLPARWVIHTVGPVWHGGLFGERKKLLSCYRNSLALAAEQGCESVAFPLISSGAYGYPKDKALDAAREAIEGFLQEQDMTVYLVVYGEESLSASQKLFAEVREYIDREYVRQHPYRRNEAARKAALREESGSFPAPGAIQEEDANSAPLFMIPAPKKRKESAICPPAPAQSDGGLWEEESSGEPGNWPFGRLDESFQQMLLRLIDQRGMTDAECYKRANIDRKLFSKIRKDVHYKPSKPTVLAFAVALRLELGETEELLEKAGFALSRSSEFDLILRYYIERRVYDVFRINEALFEFDQTLLGTLS